MVISKEQIEVFTEGLATLFKTKDIEQVKLHSKSYLDPINVISADDLVFSSVGELEASTLRQFEQVDEFNINSEISDYTIHNDICWCSGTFRGRFRIGQTWQDINFRFSYVFQEIDNEIYLRQAHYSLPNPSSEGGRGWPSPTGMAERIKNWIEEFDINPNIDEVRHQKVREYLVKAKELMESN